MSTVNACCAVCATLRIPSAKPSTPRAQEGKAHNRRAPQNFPLQLGLRSHLAVARLLPVHWLRPLTTPATTPAKVHAGLNRDFLKKTPCAPHSRSPSPAVFFLSLLPINDDRKARQTALSPKFSLSETTVPLDRPRSTHGAAPDFTRRPILVAALDQVSSPNQLDLYCQAPESGHRRPFACRGTYKSSAASKQVGQDAPAPKPSLWLREDQRPAKIATGPAALEKQPPETIVSCHSFQPLRREKGMLPRHRPSPQRQLVAPN